MKPSKLFSENYKIDESTNLYMIEVGLDRYGDIFSDWDPAPFKRRDIDPDLKIYLEGSSDEIPFRYPIELCFILPNGSHNELLEEETKQGLKNSFNFKRYLLGKELKQVNSRILRFIVIGFALLSVAGIFSRRTEELLVLSTLLEGIFIAGWVFLWEAVSLFFFTNRELYHRYQTYKRLQSAPVFFREAAMI
jgi:hypothetical protein